MVEELNGNDIEQTDIIDNEESNWTMKVNPKQEDNDGFEEVDEEVDEEENAYEIHAGDVFMDDNSILDCCVLSVSDNTSKGRFLSVRLFGTINDSIETTEEEFRNYVANNGLEKLNSRKDMMLEVSKKMILEPGQIYTRNGEMLIEILSKEMLYINQKGEMIAIIGCKTKDDTVAYRDALEIKSIIFGNSDQFSEV